MKIKMKYYTIFSLICISGVLAAPSVTDDNSWIVSSTEPSKEATSDTSKEDAAPSVPKIYEMKVDTNVSNRFATTLVTSKVKNLAKTAQEATFSVVLPETAYITGFVMEIDGKSYAAYVKEKEEAKQIYDQAVQSGQAAAHVEANARDSNRFTVSVNVEPQSKATFRLTYEELLQRSNGQYEIVLNIHPGQPVKDLNVEVRINETQPLKFVRSPSLRTGNEIGKNNDKLESQADIDVINSTSAVVKFSPDVERQKQLASGLGTKEENGLAGQFIVQYDVERDTEGGVILVKDGYFVHFFSPSELKPLPKQVVFVLDTSGSMDGIRIQQLKEAMNSILSELKPEDIFNIVEFSSTVRVWNVDDVKVQYEEGSDPWAVYNRDETDNPPKNKTEQVLPPAYEANEANLKKAKEVVSKLNAYGGTDIKSGLEVGLKLIKKNKEDKKDTHQPLIVFLTDGEPTVGETRPNKIISSIKEINSGEIRSPIFSLSFGDGADRDFLQKISLKNLGFARHIYEASDASLQLQEFYHQISSPLLNNVTFKYVSNVTKVTKTNFPIFFGGSECCVAGRIDIIDPGFAPFVHGWGIHGPIDLIPKVIENPVGALERLWAYLTIKQILEARDAADNKTQYTRKALDIALKYSFVTPVSSLVVVKPNDTRAVDTEDASKSGNDRPYYLKNFASGVSLHGAPGSSGFTNFGGAVALSGGHQLAALPARYQPASQVADRISFNAVPAMRIPLGPYSTTPIVAATTIVTSTTEISDKYSNLKAAFPWLSKILNENGILTSPPGNYKLGVDEQIADHPECPKTPVNGTVGICTLLPNCPQVYSLLTDENVFVEYICLVDKIAGICCPKSSP